MPLTETDWKWLLELQGRIPIEQVGKKALLTQLFGINAKNGQLATIGSIPGNREFFIELNDLVENLQDDSVLKNYLQCLEERILNSADKERINSRLSQLKVTTMSPSVTSAQSKQPLLRVLFLEAVPFYRDRLDTVTEYTNIVHALAKADLLGRVEIIPPQYNASLHELVNSVECFRPNLLHISAHGKSNKILLIGGGGKDEPITPEGLGNFLALHRDNLHCCIFNACNSDEFAKIVSKSIEYTIGCEGQFLDSDALVFSKAFYKQLSRTPNDFVRAFQFGKLALGLVDPIRAEKLKLFARGSVVQL
ncbi:MAG: hypothetical protein ACK6AO_04395 [Planctomycetota bacterium]